MEMMYSERDTTGDDVSNGCYSPWLMVPDIMYESPP